MLELKEVESKREEEAILKGASTSHQHSRGGKKHGNVIYESIIATS